MQKNETCKESEDGNRKGNALVLLKLVHDHFESSYMLPHPDGPGHSHSVRGRWDRDGSICEWCQTWDLVRECVQQNDMVTRVDGE